MNTQPHLLLVGDDPALSAEVAAALAGVRRWQPVVRPVGIGPAAVEAARSWRPQLALVEMSADAAQLQQLAIDLRRAAPETLVVGLYRPDVLHHHDGQTPQLLFEAVRAGVRDFLRRPPSSTDLSTIFDRLLTGNHRGPVQIGQVVTFLSNKGGVGKSTLAVNSAVALARRHPGQVLLVDASLQIGSCANLLDLRPVTTLVDAARQRDRLDETFITQLATVHQSGLHLLAAPVDTVESTVVTDELIARVLTLARRTYEYVIVDTFPLVDRIALAVLDQSDATYIVFENTVPTLLGIAQLLELLGSLNVPAERQRLVLNRAQAVVGNPRPAEIVARLGRTIDHTVPFDRRFITAANLGESFLDRAGWWNTARRRLLRLVDEIEGLSTAGAHDSAHLPAPEPTT